MATRPGDVDLTSFLAYNTLAVPLLLGGVHLARFTNEKARLGLEGRRDLFPRLAGQAAELQGGVWFHASSAGEYEQGRPMIRALRAAAEARGIPVPTLLTLFSPSGYGHAQRHPETDVVEYLPFDTAPAAKRMIELVRPRALVFVKFDCWPNLIWAARRAGVPLLLLGANFPPGSQRTWPVARGFFRRLFDCFEAIGAVGDADARRFEDLGVRTRVEVTGDTRVDQVVHRWEAAEDAPLVRAFAAAGWKYLMLGSCWPPGEERVLGPFADALARHQDLGLIIAPHEPSPEHLAHIEADLAGRGLVATRLSELVELRTHRRRATAAAKDPARWRVVVVDTVGILAELYRAGVLTYVGGGFTTGVHNVLEPAITGQPVLFGPRHHNAPEAAALVDAGAGQVVESAGQVRDRLEQWLVDREALTAAGRRAQDLVLQQRGATARTLELLEPYAFGA